MWIPEYTSLFMWWVYKNKIKVDQYDTSVTLSYMYLELLLGLYEISKFIKYKK